MKHDTLSLFTKVKLFNCGQWKTMYFYRKISVRCDLEVFGKLEIRWNYDHMDLRLNVPLF